FPASATPPVVTVTGGPCAGGAEKQLPPVRKREVPAVASHRAIFGPETFDDDFDSNRERVSCKSPPVERIRRTAFDHPALHLAVRPLHVDVDPRVRIDPFHFLCGALQSDRA